MIFSTRKPDVNTYLPTKMKYLIPCKYTNYPILTYKHSYSHTLSHPHTHKHKHERHINSYTQTHTKADTHDLWIGTPSLYLVSYSGLDMSKVVGLDPSSGRTFRTQTNLAKITSELHRRLTYTKKQILIPSLFLLSIFLIRH